MKVRIDYRPEREMVDVRVFAPTSQGSMVSMLTDSGGRLNVFQEFATGSELPVSLSIPRDVWDQMIKQGTEDVCGQLARADDAIQDARAIRDRLLKIVEES